MHVFPPVFAIVARAGRAVPHPGRPRAVRTRGRACRGDDRQRRTARRQRAAERGDAAVGRRATIGSRRRWRCEPRNSSGASHRRPERRSLEAHAPSASARRHRADGASRLRRRRAAADADTAAGVARRRRSICSASADTRDRARRATSIHLIRHDLTHSARRQQGVFAMSRKRQERARRRSLDRRAALQRSRHVRRAAPPPHGGPAAHRPRLRNHLRRRRQHAMPLGETVASAARPIRACTSSASRATTARPPRSPPASTPPRRRHRRDGRRPAARAGGDSEAARQAGRRLRHRQRMARAARRQPLDAPTAVEDRQLADGEAVRRVAARLRHDVQGVPGAGHQADPALRRSASVHPGARELGRRAHRGSADREHSASAERIALRALAHVARDGRSHHGPLPAEVRDAAAAFVRPARIR